MNNEYEVEVIEHPYINYLNVFLVNLDYRTPHLHEDIELILVLDGHVKTRTRADEYHLEPNSCVLINSHQPHEFHSSEGGTLILCLQVSPKFCSSYYPAISALHFDSHDIDQHVTKEYQDYVKALMIEIAYQYYAKQPGYEFSCISLLNQLFWIFFNKLPYHILSEEERKANIQRTERLNRILNYIGENYMNKIRLSDIAKSEHLSMSYLSHFIKDNLNQTFQEYLNNIRFSHAREMLLEKRMKFIDICMECGFSDYRYLYQAFLKNYGCTPKEYQNLHKPVNPIRKYRSPESSETFYTIENTISILEKLHTQNLSLISRFPNPLISQ
jgi:AraC-like DNA-binding protein